MKPSEILIKAKANIEDPSRWTQHALFDTNGCMCAIGAVAMAINPDAMYGKITRDAKYVAHDFARRHIARTALADKSYGVASYNDNPYTTHQDIMEMFDRSIQIAKRKERIQSIKNFFKL